MFRRINKAQSTAEYAVVLSVVIAAIIGMQIYVRRGLSARVKAGTDAFTSAGVGFNFTAHANVTGLTSPIFSNLSQYEPYYAESSFDTYSENVEQEHMGSGAIVKEKVSDIQVRRAGGRQSQRGAENATNRQGAWYNVSTGQ
jgi:hypothetical protein